MLGLLDVGRRSAGGRRGARASQIDFDKVKCGGGATDPPRWPKAVIGAVAENLSNAAREKRACGVVSGLRYENEAGDQGGDVFFLVKVFLLR